MLFGGWFMCYYRLQTKFAKVMFLHVSVSHSVHRGSLAHCMLGYTPQTRGRHPLPRTRHAPRADIPQDQAPPRSACWEIWATSRRYASYWNAILFGGRFMCYLVGGSCVIIIQTESENLFMTGGGGSLVGSKINIVQNHSKHISV